MELVKKRKCSDKDCVNKNIEVGISCQICKNCQEELKDFVKK